MKWDPEVGQLGWREIWVWLHNDDKPTDPYIVDAQLFVITKPRKSGAGLSCSVLLEYTEGYKTAEPCTLGYGFIDRVFLAEEKLTSTRTVHRRPASNEDINWLFSRYNKKSTTCYSKWLHLVKKEFVERRLLSLNEYERLQTLIEPFLPYHPRNRYQED